MEWYGPEWSFTNALIRFPYNSADVTISTVLGHLSSYTGQVKMGQYSVGGFVNTQVFSHWRIMGQAHNCFPVFFLYHYLTLYIHLTQSHLEFAILSAMLNLSWTLTFSASSTENDLEHGSRGSSFCALISCSLLRRSLLTHLIVGLRTRPSLIHHLSLTVSRWDV